jgi:SPP1 family predicted phage head-tail adaptor
LIALADTSPPAIGSLRDRVQIKRRDMSPEDEGGSIATFVPIATVWARVRELSSTRTQLGDGRAVNITHSVVLRYRTDISPGDRLTYRGRNLDVSTANAPISAALAAKPALRGDHG